MYRRLALFTCLLLFIWTVACSSKSSSENAEAPAPLHISGSKQVTVPAGAVVTVRLDRAVGSKLSATGDHFSATVARPVKVEGKVVVPAELRP